MFESSPTKGMLVMLSFGIGTVPAMLFASKIFQMFSPKLRKRLASFSGVIVILFGIWAILRAFGIGHHH